MHLPNSCHFLSAAAVAAHLSLPLPGFVVRSAFQSTIDEKLHSVCPFLTTLIAFFSCKSHTDHEFPIDQADYGWQFALYSPDPCTGATGTRFSGSGGCSFLTYMHTDCLPLGLTFKMQE